MDKRSLLFLLFVISACLAKSNFGDWKPDKKYSAVYDPDTEKWYVREGDQGVAWATLSEESDKTGWNILEVVARSSSTDQLKAYGAGYIEGALTHHLLWSSFRNFANGTAYNADPRLKSFILANDAWVRSMAANATENRDFWNQVSLVLLQFDGLLAAYNTFAPSERQISYFDFLAYQLTWELSDLQIALGLSTPTPDELVYNSHCSVLLKLSSDGKKFFSSHVTWTSYSTMLRIFKHYSLDFSEPSTKAVTVSFSSFPGNLPSGDDYFLTDQNLFVTETTNSVMNMSLYDEYVTTSTVPYWIRVTIANRVATNGQDWLESFKLYNSGTYNNQWMIVDYKLFTPGNALEPNTFWIGEQIPGYLETADMTDFINTNSHWVSYNIPYFQFIYNISGYPAYYQKYGNAYSYSKCPRAQIFARDVHTVETMDDMKRIMRYNQYQYDELSLEDPCNAISCRADLRQPWISSPQAFGAIDCKLTDNTMISKMKTKAVSGPTWESQPPFAWTSQWNSVPHYGHPKVFSFDFVDIAPKHRNN